VNVNRFVLALVLLLTSLAPAHARQKGPLVLAAASLQESLTEATAKWAARGHPRPVLSFAASSALARQIESGAAADMFISADEDWMNAVQAKGMIQSATRASFLGNRLVLIAPAANRATLRIGNRFPLARALGNGRLAMADPDSVPAGKYGREALSKLGVWSSVESKVARGENVRAALALVERGEAPFGIVYATDAKASKQVRVVGVFPAASHPPIIYPVALLKASTHQDAEPFRRFLLSAQSKAIFARYGFSAR
jgi:molybdate transport system substrate-binding protein